MQEIVFSSLQECKQWSGVNPMRGCPSKIKLFRRHCYHLHPAFPHRHRLTTHCNWITYPRASFLVYDSAGSDACVCDISLPFLFSVSLAFVSKHPIFQFVVNHLLEIRLWPQLLSPLLSRPIDTHWKFSPCVVGLLTSPQRSHVF